MIGNKIHKDRREILNFCSLHDNIYIYIYMVMAKLRKI